MTRLILSIPGLEHEVILAHEVEMVPSVGDRIYMHAEYLDTPFRLVLEKTPAFRCFERNETTECMNMAEYLRESVITVLGRGWSYENGISCCHLEVNVEY